MKSPTWVFVAGAYRTASTTQYMLTRDIVEETDNGIGIGYHTESKLEEYDDPKHGRYIICKVFKFLPETSPFGEKFLSEDRLRALCTIRDPRDIMVSMRTRAEQLGDVTWDFGKKAREDFPTWLGQLAQWINLGPDITLLSKFEVLTRNLYREVNRITRHLEIDLDTSLAHDIAARYTVRALRARKRQKRADGEREDPYLPSVPAVLFGSSGLFNTWLNGSETKLIETHNEEFMRRFGYLEQENRQ